MRRNRCNPQPEHCNPQPEHYMEDQLCQKGQQPSKYIDLTN